MEVARVRSLAGGRRWLLAGAAPLVLFGATLLLPASRCILLGVCRGEHFYRARPMSYWSSVLRRETQVGVRPDYPAWYSLRCVLHLDMAGLFDWGLAPESFPDADAAESVPVLLGLLRENGEEVVGRAVQRHLGVALRDQPSKAARALVNALDDRNAAVWQLAIQLLRLANPPEPVAIPKLTQMLRDPDTEVRLRAAEALQAIDSSVALPTVIQVLCEALHERDADDRKSAAYLLGNIGPPARAAVPSLTALLGDTDPEVRELAAKALEQIES
jgi:hypothetical protein